MKITLSMNEVLERLYAITALRGYVNEPATGYVAHILSPAQASALQIVVKSAFGAAMSYLAFSGWRADRSLGELCAQAPDTLDVDSAMVAEKLVQAVVNLTLYIIYSTGVDGRAEAVHSHAVDALRSLASTRLHAARLAINYL